MILFSMRELTNYFFQSNGVEATSMLGYPIMTV